MDVCVATEENAKEVGCTTMSALVDICKTIGFEIKDWRTAVGCGMFFFHHSKYL